MSNSKPPSKTLRPVKWSMGIPSVKGDDLSRNQESGKSIRLRSGCIDSDDKLTAFLYILLRDHIPAGAMEEIARGFVEYDDEPRHDYEFSNGWLAQYAQDLANRLRFKK